jgi:hypothetical protein
MGKGDVGQPVYLQWGEEFPKNRRAMLEQFF